MAQISVTPVEPTSTVIDRKPELALRVMAPIVQFLVDQHGQRVARDILAKGALTLEQARASSGWVSIAQVEAVFAGALALFGSEEAFIAAASYKAREAFGPMVYVTWATRLGAVMELGFRSIGLFSRVGTCKVISKGSGRLRAAYYTTAPEHGRLLCMSRHGTARAIPTLWGKPPAEVKHVKCLGWGDDCCEYEVTWAEPLTHSLLLAGMFAGALLVALVSALSVQASFVWLLPIVGALVGHIGDLRARRSADVRDNHELRDALTALTKEADDARHEFAALNERQRGWLTRVEADLEERSGAWQEALANFEGRELESRGVLRAVSHDLANPLMVLKTNAHVLRTAVQSKAPVDVALLEQQFDQLERVEKLLQELSALSWGKSADSEPRYERIEVAAYAERLARRAQAFALGRSLRTSAFATREAPAFIEAELAVLDRIVDNLLTNAIKYTEGGSVVIELGGTPGYLVLKISDSGRGIEPEMLTKVFQPEGSDPNKRAPGSRGIGLSNVVRLVKKLRGRLEVLSRVTGGTTFWVHVPVNPQQAPAAKDDAVLHIRNAAE